MTVNVRFEKHRAKLRAVRRRRLELKLLNDLIDAADTFAGHHRRYLRDIVTYALKEYLNRHGVLPPSRQ